MEVYAAMVDNMDQGIGRIVAELKKHGQLDNTLILFLEDNGGCAEGMGRRARKAPKGELEPMKPDELQMDMIPKRTRDGKPTLMGPDVMPGPDGTYIGYGRGWANVSNTPFREYKHWVHEGGIATPLIAHWPARITDAGKLRHQPGQLTDIMATCVEISGAAYPARYKGNAIRPLEGKSLVAAFDDKPLEREGLYWEHENNRAVRVGKWKLVKKARTPWELYDLEADRTELNDLAAEKPKLVEQLAAKWDAWAKRAHVLPNKRAGGKAK